MFDLASMIAPASRIFLTMKASLAETEPFKDSDPAEVGISFVS